MKYTLVIFKRITIICLCLSYVAVSLFSQDTQASEQQSAELLITFGSLGMLNTHQRSAPSPIIFSAGAGAQIKILDFMSITPHAQYFGTYYLWEDDQVLPAAIEHRSAYVPSIMLDIPVTFDMRTTNSIFRIGIGASFLLRYAFLAINVPTSVQGDIDDMNEWFWQGAEFFYPSAQLSWDYIVNDRISVGLGAKAYIPVGSLIKGNGINNAIASIGVRLVVN